MIMKLLHILLVLLALQSCNVGVLDDRKTRTVELKDETHVLTHSEVMDIVGWVALESSEECFLGAASKIEEFAGNYYVLDRVIRKSVFVFDKEGKYICRIGKIGQGPGEYAQAYDFAIDRKNGHVAVLTEASRVYLYDLQGKFISSKQIDKSILWNMTSVEDGYVLSSNHKTYTEGENAYLLYAFDSDLKLTGKWERVLPNQMPTMPLLSSPFQTAGEVAYYCDVHTNSIYTYDCKTDSVEKRLNIKFSDPIPDGVRTDLATFMAKQREYDFINEMSVNNNGELLIGYSCHGKYNLAVIASDGVIGMNGRYSGHFPKLFHSEKDEFLSPVSAEEYVDYWKELPIPHYKDSISAEDNFLIMKWKLK